MDVYNGLRLVEKDGATAIIINRNRILVMKRIGIPFISYPGLWTFVAGHRKKGESHKETAYREVLEETGIEKKNLRLVAKRNHIMKIDLKRGTRYYNPLYIFRSKTREIALNIEHTKYRWATLSEVRNHKDYTNVFANEELVLRIISNSLQR